MPALLANALALLVLMAVVSCCAPVLAGYAADLLPEEIRIDRLPCSRSSTLAAAVLHGLSFSPPQAGNQMLLCSCLLERFRDGQRRIHTAGARHRDALSAGVCAHGARSGRDVASEGAFKYLLLSSIASALIMFGIAFSYGATGTLSIDAFVQLGAGGSAQGVAATVLIVSGFLFKAAVFPFHAWAPDAYSSVRVHVTAFLATLVKGAVILGLVRILSTRSLSSTMVAIVATLG
jgi:NADH-quinone oxidoreductase subunit N